MIPFGEIYPSMFYIDMFVPLRPRDIGTRALRPPQQNRHQSLTDTIFIPSGTVKGDTWLRYIRFMSFVTMDLYGSFRMHRMNMYISKNTVVIAKNLESYRRSSSMDSHRKTNLSANSWSQKWLAVNIFHKDSCPCEDGSIDVCRRILIV